MGDYEFVASRESLSGLQEKCSTPMSMMTSLTILFITVFVVSCSFGQFGISLSTLCHSLILKLTGHSEQMVHAIDTVLFKIRLPRLAVASIIGGAMALSGASYQGIFKNPMVSPDILGASAGAGFGAAIALLLSFNMFFVQISAFSLSLLAVSLTLLVSKIIARKSSSTIAMILTGMIVTSLFSALISIIKYVADPESKLPEITFWLMGGLASVGTSDALFLLLTVSVGALPLLLIRWRLNILSLGDDEAQSLGIDVLRLRFLVIGCSTLLTASCVSICGLVGWVGLIIPHISRLLVGPDFHKLLPVSILVGAIFLVLVDDTARCLFSVEIPLGIITSIIGAPFFLYMLVKGKKGWL
ncbi:iron ABC transporter permease [Desulfobulbus rhabdoformis]|nr:iron ABC transporter permease [Desulfobulbus rhabdoformis]